jgi:hypothetical protein
LRAAAGDEQIILGWDHPGPGPDGYRLYRNDGFSADLATTHYLDTGLTNGTVYTYYVTALVGAAESTPSNLACAQPYDITPGANPGTVTCTAGALNCPNAQGAPDDQMARINGAETITMDFGVGGGIIDGSGYDVVFYEYRHPPGGPTPDGIQLDYVTIEISHDGATWYTIFDWDGDPPGTTDVLGTNVDAYADDTSGDPGDQVGEFENEQIPSAVLWPGGPTTNTGIAIDIGAVQSQPPPGYSYHLMRFSYPAAGTGHAEIDAVTRLN